MMASVSVNVKSQPVPIPVVAASQLCSSQDVLELRFTSAADDPPQKMILENGNSFADIKEILPKIADLAASSSSGSARIPIEIVDKILNTKDFASVSAIADDLERILTLRSFLVGYTLTVADLAVWGAIKCSSIMMGILKKGTNPHLARWFAFIDSSKYAQDTLSTISNANRASLRSRTTNATFELGLPNAKQGHVVTRFPPEPSGYLHIGHAKAAILNQYFARHYNGRFLVRFDDTNPSKENAEFQDSILEDLELLGIHGDAISYSSDYFQPLYEKGIEIIKNGKAYADDTLQAKMREERMDGIASARRDSTIEENLTRFDEMTKGSEEGSRWCLRAKIQHDHQNKALRDPVIYRCNPQPHHRTGSTWKVYPTYDFCCPVVDSIEGVTHALRTNEYRDRNPQYQWMLQALNMRPVEIWDFGRINFVYTLLSKRKLKAFVDTGRVRGWDDPRMPTVRGMRRRGMTIEGLRQYMLAQGPSQAYTSLEWDNIWTMNKKVIDPIVPRYHAVSHNNYVKASISGCSHAEPWTETRPLHKKNPDVGNKQTTFGPIIFLDQEDAKSFDDNEEITLMDWGNAIVRTKEINEKGIITNLHLDLHLQGDFRKTSKKVHFITPSKNHPLISIIMLDYDYLVTKKKMEEEDSLDDVINPQTEYIERGLAVSDVSSLRKGDIIQLERKGYFIVDKPINARSALINTNDVYENEQEAMDFVELINIPDGRISTVSLKYPPSSSSLA